MEKPIEVRVRLSPAAFRKYCAFDTFVRQRRWYAPILIGMILITVSMAGLLNLVPMGDGAAGVLMGLGLAIPMLVFGVYAVQIEAQIASQHLKENPEVYALTLTKASLAVAGRKGEAPVELPWDRLFAAFRRRDCVYLYVSPERALILPDGQANVPPEELWNYIKNRMGPGRCAEK